MNPLDLVAPCLCGCVWLQHNNGGRCEHCRRCLWFRLDTQTWPIGELVSS